MNNEGGWRNGESLGVKVKRFNLPRMDNLVDRNTDITLWENER